LNATETKKAYTAILRGFPTGYQGQPSEILAALSESFPTRQEARAAARREWGSVDDDRRSENTTIRIVDLADPNWSYLA
jgi:hypothetical protein